MEKYQEKCEEAEKKEISWSTRYYLRLPITSDLYVLNNSNTISLGDYQVKNKYREVAQTYSQINGITSVNEGNTSFIDSETISKIFRIEEDGDFANKMIRVKVLFHKDANSDQFKNEVIELIKMQNFKSTYKYYDVEVGDFELLYN